MRTTLFPKSIRQALSKNARYFQIFNRLSGIQAPFSKTTLNFEIEVEYLRYYLGYKPIV
jgi:hypothetical protein